MKTLQNDFTTPEQSKRLLELGVPADSADCCYHDYPRYNGEFNGRDKKPTILWEDESISKLKSYSKLPILPCWSVGRLIEIYCTCVDFDIDDGAAIVIFIEYESPIIQMMKMFEDKIGIMDFSKLED